MTARPIDPMDLDDLIEAWEESPCASVKMSAYFPTYVRLFGHLRGQPCTLVETGILDGGSLFMWRRWLGPTAWIVGIDLNPDAAKWRSAGFEIHIGDQGDRAFWRETLPRIGSFDAFLDDGGHQSFQQIVTLEEVIQFARQDCVVVVEDTATSFMSDFSSHGAHSFLEYAKASTDCLTGRSFDMYPQRFPSTPNTAAIQKFANVAAISFFNGIVAYQVAPEENRPSRVIRNGPSAAAADFRYRGKNSAEVSWPNLLSPQLVEIKGRPGT